MLAVLKAIAARDGEYFAVLLVDALTRAPALATGCERELVAVIDEIHRTREERQLPASCGTRPR